jgi:hypothetical protein
MCLRAAARWNRERRLKLAGPLLPTLLNCGLKF